MPKIYETNSRLGYNQKAYLIEIDNGYLVIDTLNIPLDDFYIVGNVVELEEYEVQESDYLINMSPLKGKYLFEFFLQHFHFEN